MQAASTGISASIRPFAGRVIAARNAVERANAEGRPAAGPISMLIEPFGGFLHAERTRSAIALRREPKDPSHEFCFDRIDFETLLDLGASVLGRNDAIAERRGRAELPLYGLLPLILGPSPSRS